MTPLQRAATQLILVRHGRTVWNAADRIQGQADIELDDVGQDQARRVAPLLAAYRPDLIVCSDLVRAVQTAEPLARQTGLPVEYDARLRERHFGPWQGLTLPEVAEAYPDLKANQNFLSLQEELTSTEDRIAYARQFYNDSVMKYDNKIQSIPSNIIAGMFGFKSREYFKAEEGASEVPKVQF